MYYKGICSSIKKKLYPDIYLKILVSQRMMNILYVDSGCAAQYMSLQFLRGSSRTYWTIWESTHALQLTLAEVLSYHLGCDRPKHRPRSLSLLFLYKHIFSLSLRDQKKGNILREITGNMSRDPYFQFTQLPVSFRLKYLRLVKHRMHQCRQLFGGFSLTTFNLCAKNVFLLSSESMGSL